MHRWAASEYHRERCRALGLLGYHLHDARHHWAVRMVRAGMPLEVVARQLGHPDVVMVAKVYGRFVPSHVERDRWEQAATALDREEWGDKESVGASAQASSDSEKSEKSTEMGAHGGAAPRNDLSQPPESDWPVDSRGGTRTRDPSIMSAVL
jgi:hypothetical protein